MSETPMKWETCPRCGDTRIVGGPLTVEGWWVNQQVACVCGARWIETYRAAGRSEYEYEEE